jgi:hypothetical protein
MLGIPRLPDDIIYEVRVVGEQRVYRVRHQRMMAWANGQAPAARPTRIADDDNRDRVAWNLRYSVAVVLYDVRRRSLEKWVLVISRGDRWIASECGAQRKIERDLGRHDLQ